MHAYENFSKKSKKDGARCTRTRNRPLTRGASCPRNLPLSCGLRRSAALEVWLQAPAACPRCRPHRLVPAWWSPFRCAQAHSPIQYKQQQLRLHLHASQAPGPAPAAQNPSLARPKPLAATVSDPGPMASSPDLFPNVAFSDVSAAAPAAEATAAFGLGATTGAPRLCLVKSGKDEAEPTVDIDLADAQVVAVIPVNVICG